MKVRFVSIAAFAIAMGYGSMGVSECGKRFDAYKQALSDIEKESPIVYVDLGL